MRGRSKESVQCLSMDELKAWNSCNSLVCFSVANLDSLVERLLHFQVNAGQKRRKVGLGDIRTSDRWFMYDGKPVYSEFLKKDFRFSPELQQDSYCW